MREKKSRPAMRTADVGERFGRLVVCGLTTRLGSDRAYPCECDCGTRKPVRAASLFSGNTSSCGCLHREQLGSLRRTHGRSKKTSEHRIWSNIKQRTGNPNCPRYKDYGGRGIMLCEEWRQSFSAFYSFVGDRPSPKHSIDRIDNNRGYEPGNVRWVTAKEQGRNTRRCNLGPRESAQIRLLPSLGYSNREIAKLFNLTTKNVWQIVTMATWA